MPSSRHHCSLALTPGLFREILSPHILTMRFLLYVNNICAPLIQYRLSQVIALNQDPLGQPGRKRQDPSGKNGEVWTVKLEKGDAAAVMVKSLRFVSRNCFAGIIRLCGLCYCSLAGKSSSDRSKCDCILEGPGICGRQGKAVRARLVGTRRPGCDPEGFLSAGARC